MDYNRIKTEIERKDMSVRDICCKIDVTEQGLHQMIRNKSMKIEVLERISNVLGLPVTYWFDENATKVAVHSIGINSKTRGEPNKSDTNKMMIEKIDSLTKGLNEMLKEMVSK